MKSLLTSVWCSTSNKSEGERGTVATPKEGQQKRQRRPAQVVVQPAELEGADSGRPIRLLEEGKVFSLCVGVAQQRHFFLQGRRNGGG